MKQRNYTIDILKGLAIISVVYFHLGYIAAFVFDWLQTAHIPIFVFVSGLLACGKTNISFFTYISKKAKSFLVPYFIFFVLCLVAAELYHCTLFGTLVKPNTLWLKAFLLTGEPLKELTLSFDRFRFYVLWFFVTMFFAHVIFWFVSRLNRHGIAIVMCILALISAWFMKLYNGMDFTTPFNISAIPNFVLYMCLATVLKEHFTGKFTKEKKLFISVSLILLATLLLIIYGSLGNVKMLLSLMYIPVSFMQVTGWYGLCSSIGRCKLLEYLGRISLYIYGLHIIFMETFRAIFYKLGINIRHNLPARLVILITTITLCCLCFEAYNRIKLRLTKK